MQNEKNEKGPEIKADTSNLLKGAKRQSPNEKENADDSNKILKKSKKRRVFFENESFEVSLTLTDKSSSSFSSLSSTNSSKSTDWRKPFKSFLNKNQDESAPPKVDDPTEKDLKDAITPVQSSSPSFLNSHANLPTLNSKFSLSHFSRCDRQECSGPNGDAKEFFDAIDFFNHLKDKKHVVIKRSFPAVWNMSVKCSIKNMDYKSIVKFAAILEVDVEEIATDILVVMTLTKDYEGQMKMRFFGLSFGEMFSYGNQRIDLKIILKTPITIDKYLGDGDDDDNDEKGGYQAN